MNIVRDVRLKGYIQGVDFDFEYRPPKFDDMGITAVYNRCVIFRFYKEELASWFALLYQ